MEAILFFALLGTQVVLILILTVIAQRCSNNLAGIRSALSGSSARWNAFLIPGM